MAKEKEKREHGLGDHKFGLTAHPRLGRKVGPLKAGEEKSCLLRPRGFDVSVSTSQAHTPSLVQYASTSCPNTFTGSLFNGHCSLLALLQARESVAMTY